MAYVVQKRLDEKQVISMAQRVPITAWSGQAKFAAFESYNACLSEAGNDFVVRLTKETHEERSSSKGAYSLAVYKMHMHANGEVENVFAGGVLNSDAAKKIFSDISMRDARRQLFE